MSKHLGGDPLTSSCQIAFNGMALSATALYDSGANCDLIIDKKLAARMEEILGAKRMKVSRPKVVSGYDGRSQQTIDTVVSAHLKIQGRIDRNVLFIVASINQDLMIGRKWFARNDVIIDVPRRRLLFPADWRPEQAHDILMNQIGRQLLTNPAYEEDRKRRDSLMEKEMEREDQERRRRRLTREEHEQVVHRIRELEAERRPPPPVRILQRKKVRFQLPAYDPGPDEVSTRSLDDGILKMQRQLADKPRLRSPPPSVTRKRRTEPEEGYWKGGIQKDNFGRRYILKKGYCGPYKDYQAADLAFTSARGFLRILRRDTSIQACETSLMEIDHIIKEKEAARLAEISEEMGDDVLPEDDEELRQKAWVAVPPAYRDLLSQFSKAESDKLSDPRPGVDHKIELVPGGDPHSLGVSPLWKLSEEELKVAREYIAENLEKGFIVPSNTPWAAPILMAPKPGGGLRFCVDYRKLNALTKKDRYPLPLIEENLSRISKAKIFTKIDIRQAFHKIRMDPDSVDLTTFRCRYGTFKYTVLPFGLTNGPATFQRFINWILRDLLDDFCHAYIDDILIFSENEEDHEAHVRKVLERLRDHGLQADLKKCEFNVTETKYLGFIIGTKGISVDPAKVAVVSEWNEPTTVKGVQAFLGFCNFYRKFVKDFSRVAKPLTSLTRKDTAFNWTNECSEAFDELKRKLTTTPVLHHYHPDRETIVETDASDGVCAGVLSQRDPNDGHFHPVAYYSESMHGAELNYGIHDKELLAVILALKCWRAELIGLQRDEFLVVTDHRALEYFSTKRQLNLRQAGWADLLAQYNFKITYRPGKDNEAADALSRKTEVVRTQKGKMEAQRLRTIFQRVENQEVYRGWAETAGTDDVDDTGLFEMSLDTPKPHQHEVEVVDRLLTANRTHDSLHTYRAKAADPDEEHWSMINGKYVLYKGRLIVPNDGDLRTRLLDEVHSRTMTAHPSRNKTRRLVAAKYWWPRMASTVDQYVANCVCASAKVPRDKTPGLLHPIPAPDRPWTGIVMDFKTLTESRSGHKTVLVVIDRLSKQSWTIPCRDMAPTAKTAALLYYFHGPFRVYGLPDEIGSDRGPQFVSGFTEELSKILGIKWKLSSSGHSQSAGQAEIMNEYLDQRLRPWVNHYQDNWPDFLPAMDFAQLTLPHESLEGLSPFEVLRGYAYVPHYDWAKRTREDAFQGLKDRVSRKDAQRLAKALHDVQELARASIKRQQDRMTVQANKHRREPDFGVGDWVIIRKKVSSTDRPSDKLDYPMTRNRYKIKEMVGHSYRLEVPQGWRGTDIFHADRLRRHPNNPLTGQGSEQPAGEVIEGQEEWEVERVLASRTSGKARTLQYKVQWKGWDPDETWYPASDFKNAAELVRQFHKDNPDKPGPPVRLEEWLRAASEDRSDPKHPDDNKAAGNEGLRVMRRRRL